MISDVQRERLLQVINRQPTNPPTPRLTADELDELRGLLESGREDDAWADLSVKSQAAFERAFAAISQQSAEMAATIERQRMERKFAAQMAVLESQKIAVPAPADAPAADLEYATLGGGCFWCLEAVFEQLNGVESVVSGYCGGDSADPNYQQICSGQTGHAEVVRVAFSPSILSYRALLEVFFTLHDPTTRNRQGNDVGTQYRSVIFYHSSAQQDVATSLMAELQQKGAWSAPMVTELVAVPNFYAAEADHQHYFARNPQQGYCQIVIAPKLNKFRQHFSERIKSD
jgi:peptide-methionine (S)-S-oxide reductase